MNRLIPALAAACFSLAAATAMAQAPSGDAGKGPGSYGPGGPRHGMRNCSQAADPAKCEAERKERYERVKQAREACKDKPDRRGCMAEQLLREGAGPGQVPGAGEGTPCALEPEHWTSARRRTKPAPASAATSCRSAWARSAAPPAGAVPPRNSRGELSVGAAVGNGSGVSLLDFDP